MKVRKVAMNVVGGLLALVVLAVGGPILYVSWRMPIDTPNGVDEAFFVQIRGREEHIVIRGHDKSNPVLLLLHGGPGFGTEPLTPRLWPYEQAYTLVQWDQPGAARTFRRADETLPGDLTVEDVVDDAIAVAQIVKERLQVDKLIVLGWSWGTVIGVEMVKRRPDLIAAYVGTGQLTSFPAYASWLHERAINAARATGNSEAIADLERIGRWPYRSFDDYVTMRMWQGRLDRQPPLWLQIAPAYAHPRYSFADSRSYARGVSASLLHFLGANMDGPLTRVDLPATSTAFDVPIIFIQGENDLNTPAVLAKDYFERISAPQKVYVPIDGGHGALIDNSAAFLAAMDTHVRPLAPRARQ